MKNLHKSINKLIGNNICQRRQDLDFSLEKLSSYTSIPFAELTLIEQGEENISINQLVNISHALHIEISYFYQNNYELDRLIAAYVNIADNAVRQKVLRLAEAMGDV